MKKYFNAIQVTESIVKWLREWFKDNGHGCNAIVGVSGGIDSSVTAALCVEALGKERVHAVLMPCDEQDDIEYSYFLCGQLGIKFTEINIKESVESISEQIEKSTGIFSEQSKINLPARIRMATLYAYSQSHNGRVINTCNLSEDYIGYNTRYGGSVGDCAPLANLTKTEIKLLAKELGLDDVLIQKVPSDGLCGKTDEDRFGFAYETLDRYILTGECDDMNIKNKIDMLHKQNLFKLESMPKWEKEN